MRADEAPAPTRGLASSPRWRERPTQRVRPGFFGFGHGCPDGRRMPPLLTNVLEGGAFRRGQGFVGSGAILRSPEFALGHSARLLGSLLQWERGQTPLQLLHPHTKVVDGHGPQRRVRSTNFSDVRARVAGQKILQIKIVVRDIAVVHAYYLSRSSLRSRPVSPRRCSTGRRAGPCPTPISRSGASALSRAGAFQ